MITKEQYEQAIEDSKKAEAIITQYNAEQIIKFGERLKSKVPFTDEELVYAAWNRCVCGHGLAYPLGCGGNHYWDCSAILKRIADKHVKHTAQLPFSTYSIKSENQPSANGATTRGTVVPKELK